MDHKIITIARQFGSGGHTIGRAVAEKLGIHCYDHEILDKLAEESGLSKDYIRKESEYAAHSSWTAVAFSSVRSMGVPTNQDYIWAIQRKLILSLAEKESFVIVGRCADTILENDFDLLKVFIHASDDFRSARVEKKYGKTDVPTDKRLRDMDKRRAMYYQFYTDKEWGKLENYDIALDSGRLGFDKCVDIIADLYNHEIN